MRRVNKFKSSLTVELIRIRPPAGIVRTIQANNDLSSRRELSVGFEIVVEAVCPVEENASGKIESVGLLCTISLWWTEWLVTDDSFAAELACSANKTWSSCPSLASVAEFCSYTRKKLALIFSAVTATRPKLTLRLFVVSSFYSAPNTHLYSLVHIKRNEKLCIFLKSHLKKYLRAFWHAFISI